MNSSTAHTFSRLAGIVACTVSLCCSAMAATIQPELSATIQPELSAIGGDVSPTLLGGGRGVIIGILDGGIATDHPALRGSLLAQRDFTTDNRVLDAARGVGHGTGVAGIYVGHDSGYFQGLAPSALYVNARVNNSHDQTTAPAIGNGLFWSLSKGAKVINLSLGYTTHHPGRDPLNLMLDYAAEHYGTLIVGAAGNQGMRTDGTQSALTDAPGGNYNAMTIGALSPTGGYRQTAGFSDYSISSDDRTKPDLVAPGQNVTLPAANWSSSNHYATGSGTSFATPMVGGVLAEMAGYGARHRLSTDPMLLKAILMSSADKIWEYDGTPWKTRNQFYDPTGGWRIEQPLDAELGAGRLDAVQAYHLYAQKPDHTTPVAKWSEGNLRSGRTFEMSLGFLKAGFHLDATLTWLRHVAATDTNKNHVIDGNDTFYESASLAHFDLELVQDGKTVVTSESSVDNLQNISWTLKQGANYTLRVYRLDDGGLGREGFALAARVLRNYTDPTALGTTADGQPASAATMASAMAVATGAARSVDYVDPTAPLVVGELTSVPEPQGTVFAVAVIALLICRRPRRART